MLLLAASSILCGFSYVLSKGRPWGTVDLSDSSWLWHVPEALLVVAVIPALVVFLARQLAALAPSTFSPRHRQSDWPRFGDWIFLLAAGAWWVVTPSIAAIVLFFMFWAVAQLIVAMRAEAAQTKIPALRSMNMIAVLFFCSGFSAVIYQVVWQRTLFAVFGSDVESVTIIVSVFMFGLGIGAILGNFLLRLQRYRLVIFVVIEILIGTFGVFSLAIAHHLPTLIEASSHTALFLGAYALFAVPTLLMGATLPVLVAYLDAQYRDIGRSSGFLYAVNTWGSACAAFVAVIVVFALVGQQVAVWIAATLNVLTAVMIYLVAPRLMQPIPIAKTMAATTAGGKAEPAGFAWALLLSALIGFIVLAQELVWFRMLGLASGSEPRVFGVLLGCVLLGIGCGSYRVKLACERGEEIRPLISSSLYAAAVLSFLVVPLVAYSSGISARWFGVVVGFVVTGMTAFLTGGVLPGLAALIATGEGQRDSLRLSWVYAANVFGATLGPLVVGYALFGLVRFETVSVVLAVCLLGMAALLARLTVKMSRKLILTAILFVATAPLFNERALERIQYEQLDPPTFAERVDSRASVVTAKRTPSGLIIYGGGAYDGAVNINPILSLNAIDRAYAIPTLHRNPERVLEIGLSSGAWAKVISQLSSVKSLVSVEINPGYLDIIRRHPVVSSILKDPRLKIEIDDGRRWLRRNPGQRFDLIVMNTTLHWRSNTTNLLSVEFLRLCKQHLREGGVMYYNATASADSEFTAASVFRYVVRYGSFVAASETPFSLTKAERLAGLAQFRTENGEQLTTASLELAEFFDRLARIEHADVGESLRQRKDLSVITDDNMLTEFKR